jgi:isoleucyl-tRNA synthetase
MQHAQWHYPFENEEKFQEQHPADFICEAVDQTRGWFYSLHAISTLLFDEESFKNVICLGLILDEEGQKMSKSRGNVVSPWDVLKKHGADAFRWYLYTASPPGQERRFSSNLVGEVVRNFTLTVWNVYSFFVTYANIDEWDPRNEEPRDFNPLDQWLRSELHSLIKEITRGFEDYDVLRATRPIQEFVDALSNWYLRRSRRRYWKSEADADKNAAYTVLYEVLVTLSKLLAPTMPFLADAMYRNLVGSVEEDAELSVHLEDWPEFKGELIDGKLNEDMSLIMKLASLGHAARNNSGIKVRQPLSEVSFSVGSASEAQALKSYTDILTDELNVKEIQILSSADEAVSHNLNPYPRQLGQKYQALFPKVREAILDLDQKEAAEKLLNEEPIFVTVEGEELKILPEEVEVRAQAKEGLEVASDGAYLAALSTEITPDLKKEGLARDVVRRIQDFRKQADFDISDRIRISYQATSDLTEAIQEHKQYIMEETLAVDLEEGAPKEGSFVSSAEFEGEKLTVGLEVVE